MTEEEFLLQWTRDRPVYEAWGQHVVDSIIRALVMTIAPLSADVFIRIPPKIRLKADASFLEKAFYRRKHYSDPYGEITDKVGVRFVVLLTQDIRHVQTAIESCPDWVSSKDRDFEEEQQKSPISFDYADVHYVVKSKNHMILSSHAVPVGTPCEVQVKTILQHAYSELTHDTIYKPNILATTGMRRTAAKSMALIEATNDYFSHVVEEVAKLVGPEKSFGELLAKVYREHLSVDPEPTRADGLLLEAYGPTSGVSVEERVHKLLTDKPYLIDAIRRNAFASLLFRQPSILLVYLLVREKPIEAQEIWPLTRRELRPIFVDLGIALD
jgi:putative GTP pyrophosphokinase